VARWMSCIKMMPRGLSVPLALIGRADDVIE
jgi:hypothetical protein